MSIQTHRGTCLCGDLAFDVSVDLAKASSCNCTVCNKYGVVASVVQPAAFTLRTPETALASFTRHPEIGTRYFCARCHVYGFSKGHLAMLGGDFVSINLGCIEAFDQSQAEMTHWDGRHDNWAAGPRPTRWPIVSAK